MKLPSKTLPFFLYIFAAFLIQSCDDNSLGLNFDDAPPPFDTSQAVRDTTIADNIDIFVIQEGEGPFEVVPRDIIDVQFTGRTESGRIFDSSFNSRSATISELFPNLTPSPIQRPECSNLNINGVCPPLVEGLRKGLVGMKVGEQRTIVIPPEAGYTDLFVNQTGRVGENGFDLRGQTLTYDVELISID